MQMKKRRGRTQQNGFTLIELLVVITILGILAGIMGLNLVGVKSQADADATRIQLKAVEDSLDVYKIRFNRYPSTAEGLSLLVNPAKGKALMKAMPKDAWQNDFLYLYPGTKNPNGFDLYSKGEDGIDGTEDDISASD